MITPHKNHRTKQTSRPLPYSGPIQARRPNPYASGGVRYIERCSCGYVRERNVNGAQTELGAWQGPTSHLAKVAFLLKWQS
jgi:hypothetical protein